MNFFNLLFISLIILSGAFLPINRVYPMANPAVLPSEKDITSFGV